MRTNKAETWKNQHVLPMLLYDLTSVKKKKSNKNILKISSIHISIVNVVKVYREYKYNIQFAYVAMALQHSTSTVFMINIFSGSTSFLHDSL